MTGSLAQPLPMGVSGACHPAFSAAVAAFAKLFPSPHLGGGALSVYLRGEPVVDVWAGWSDRAGSRLWQANTGALAFSSTKGLTSTIIHRLVDRGLLTYDEPVADYWPAFAANGKSAITLRQLMAHRGGLSRLTDVPREEILDELAMEARMAHARVGRSVGRSAYHALTYGWIMSGIARAVTGVGMRELFRTELALPLNTDGIHLGRPPCGSPTEVAETLLPHSGVINSVIDLIGPKLAALPFSGMLGTLYFPGALATLQNDIEFLDAEIPSANAVLTARGLAKAYAAIANGGTIDGQEFLSADVAAGLTGRRSFAPDLVVGVPMSFHLGYHNSPVPGLLPGFGHSGLGGSIGWADPAAKSSFGFVHNRLVTPQVLDQASFARLAVVLRQAIRVADREPVTPVQAFGAAAPAWS